MPKIRPAVKYHGGKFYLCNWIVSHFPSHATYVEPFGGAASVLLNKKAASVEVYNDLEPSIANLMRVMRDQPSQFQERLKDVAYSKEVYFAARSEQDAIGLDWAVNTLIVKRMSRGGLGGTFCWSNRIYHGLPGEVFHWENLKKYFPLISARLEGVHIHNEDAIAVMQRYDSENTVHYLDPPYLKETRSFKNAYKYEMTYKDHERLAWYLKDMKGKVLLSGYPSPLYQKLYEGWTCEIRRIPNQASQLKKKDIKTECLWMNFQCTPTLPGASETIPNSVDIS
jgi:DNA adenine methylase